MRKNHHGKKDRLVKRVFALCLALAVICTCLVPVFATEGLIDPQVHQEASRPVDDGVASYPDDEAAGFGGDEVAYPDGNEAAYPDGNEAAGLDGGFPAVDEGDFPAVDDGESGGENPGEGGTVKETEWGTVIEYDTSTSTSTDPSSSTETQWSGEDDVVEKPDDKVVVSGDEIKKLQDMVVYRFWLRELNTLDLQDITAQAQINNMTESEYLARNGEVLWNLYFIQAVPRVETIADYSSYIENPSSNRDPKGELRLFDYWYTLDEFGNRVRLNLTDPTSNILDDKTTTVNVYAAWKDGTVGSDEEEDVDHEDLVDKNPVPVDLETKASASYEDEDGELKTTTLPVEVKNLPSAADHLSVIHMGYDDVGDFYENHLDDFGSMAPILGLKISPKNAKGETVQPAKGDVATVTVSGLEKLPEMEGATADTLKVFHETSDGNVEILDVLTYTNGTLTFETSSFSPFVLALAGGYDVETLDIDIQNQKVAVGETITVEGNGKDYTGLFGVKHEYEHQWSMDKSGIVEITGTSDNSASFKGLQTGTVVITHKYREKSKYINHKWEEESFTIRVTQKLESGQDEAAVYFLYDMTKNANANDTSHWRGPVLVNGANAVVNTTGASWEDGFVGNVTYPNKNIKQNVSNYIVNWPDLETGTTWKLNKTVRTQHVEGGTIEQVVYDKFLTQLKDAGMTDEQLKKLGVNDIDITLVPYKISRENSTDPDKHIDCNIVITCNSAFTAKFNVKLPTDSVYETRSTKIYLNGDTVKLCNGDTGDTIKKYAPESFTDKNGVTWIFDGWYPEDDAGTDPNLQADPISTWPYTVQDYQLTNNRGDRVVNFYAHYKKATSNVTITKQVTGLLGDTNKDFEFRVSITQNGVDCTGVTAKKGNDSVSLNDIKLKHGETVTLENVPIGATIKVTEVTPGEHYTVSANGKAGVEDASGNVTFTYVAVANTPTTTANDTGEAALMLLSMDEDTAVDADGDAVAYDSGIKVDNNQIIVTNHATLIPDTGVLLDTLPYIVILAVVAGGVALLMLRKHRKEDD